VDVFNPESARRANEDIYINPASQDIYADFYNGVLGTDLTWEQIFEQTDRDINLQRVMNVMRYGSRTGDYDWIPDRAIGPTEDPLYEAEADFNDGQVAAILGVSGDEAKSMPTSRKREILMEHRKKELARLIGVYYEERGWGETGIPTVATLQRLGLWDFLNGETRARLQELTA
jgi:aldehyde:ferredoxin oxidoreductase